MESMTRNVRTYDHFCAVARALEQVGDRWSLLVIRDLLTGAKRFTDLMDRLGGITPKTLSQRLRELDDAGNRHRRPPAGPAGGLVPADTGRSGARARHRYARLVGATARLAPAHPGEPLHGEHLLRNAIRAIDRATDDHEPARWHFHLDGSDYLAESDGHQWSLAAEAPSAPADVTITATTQALTALIFAGSDADIDITGKPRAVERFRRLISTMATVVHPV